MGMKKPRCEGRPCRKSKVSFRESCRRWSLLIRKGEEKRSGVKIEGSGKKKPAEMKKPGFARSRKGGERTEFKWNQPEKRPDFRKTGGGRDRHMRRLTREKKRGGDQLAEPVKFAPYQREKEKQESVQKILHYFLALLSSLFEWKVRGRCWVDQITSGLKKKTQNR